MHTLEALALPRSFTPAIAGFLLLGAVLVAGKPTGLTAQTPGEEVRDLAEASRGAERLRHHRGTRAEDDPGTHRTHAGSGAPPSWKTSAHRSTRSGFARPAPTPCSSTRRGNAVAIRYGPGRHAGLDAGGGAADGGAVGTPGHGVPGGCRRDGHAARGHALRPRDRRRHARASWRFSTVLRALEAAGIETEADVRFIGDRRRGGARGLGDLRGMKYLFAMARTRSTRGSTSTAQGWAAS